MNFQRQSARPGPARQVSVWKSRNRWLEAGSGVGALEAARQVGWRVLRELGPGRRISMSERAYVVAGVASATSTTKTQQITGARGARRNIAGRQYRDFADLSAAIGAN